MAQVMNATLERALRLAEHNDALQTLPGLDAVIGARVTRAQAKPLAASLQDQLTQASAQMLNLRDAQERQAQMRLIADLQTRLWHELKEIQKYG